jgi:hypothetical protein
MRASSWFSPREQSPDLELGLKDLPRTSTPASDGEITPPLGSPKPEPDWLKKDMSRNSIPGRELAQWAAAHDPREGSGNEADAIHDKLQPYVWEREESPEHMISGGL